MTGRPFRVRRVLVDTSAIFPLLHLDDRDHQIAESVLRTLTRERAQILVTNFVVGETHALLLRRMGRHVARSFLNSLDDGIMLPVRVTEADEARALAIINQYDDKDFSFVDATSFAIMERLGIDEGFSFDRHFRQYGWRVLPEQLP
jgi:uncharacterized protein